MPIYAPTTAGDLDKRITLRRPVASLDSAYGSQQITWSDVATVWAQVVEQSASESTTAEQRTMTRRADVRIRWRADVDATCVVIYAGRTLRITGTAAVGRKRWLDLACEETDNA